MKSTVKTRSTHLPTPSCSLVDSFSSAVANCGTYKRSYKYNHSNNPLKCQSVSVIFTNDHKSRGESMMLSTECVRQFGPVTGSGKAFGWKADIFG